MEKQYKIQLPKGKAVVTAKVKVENGVMTIDVDFCDTFILPPIPPKYEPKDGDFVYICAGYEHIAIFKNKKGNDFNVYAECNNVTANFVCANLAMPLCHTKDILKIRPATEEEKKLLIDKLAERNKKWNAETKQIEDLRWRAKKNAPYYYIIGLGSIIGTTDERLPCDDNRYCQNNYFKTRSAAEKVAKQIREIFKNSKAK